MAYSDEEYDSHLSNVLERGRERGECLDSDVFDRERLHDVPERTVLQLLQTESCARGLSA